MKYGGAEISPKISTNYSDVFSKQWASMSRVTSIYPEDKTLESPRSPRSPTPDNKNRCTC